MEDKDFYKGYYFAITKEEFDDFDFINSSIGINANQFLSRGNIFKLPDKRFSQIIFDCEGNRDFYPASFRGTIFDDNSLRGIIRYTKDATIDDARLDGYYFQKASNEIIIKGVWEESNRELNYIIAYLSKSFVLPKDQKFQPISVIEISPNIKLKITEEVYQSPILNLKQHDSKTNCYVLFFEKHQLPGEFYLNGYGYYESEDALQIVPEQILNFGANQFPKYLTLFLNDTKSKRSGFNGYFILKNLEEGIILYYHIGYNTVQVNTMKFNPIKALKLIIKAAKKSGFSIDDNDIQISESNVTCLISSKLKITDNIYLFYKEKLKKISSIMDSVEDQFYI
jgi:hypothetical protein